MSTVEHAADHHETVGPKARKRLWLVFWILLAITIFEVAIAFSPLNKDMLRNIFIVLTAVKAYYIVFYFMHMKYENKNMKWTIVAPFVFLIIYFIYMMITEANYINWKRLIFDNVV